MRDLAGALAGRRPRLPDLDTRISCFREVLHANNAALGYLAQVQRALADNAPLSAVEVRRLVAGVTTQTYRMIVNLNRMTAGRFREIVSRFEQIKASLARSIQVPADASGVGYVVSLDRLDASLAEIVGQKTAFLGEARRVLGGHVPGGLGTSVEAYRAFMSTDALRERVAGVLEEVVPGDVAACFEASARATQLIESAPMPPDVAEAIERAVAALPGGPGRRFAVRSSALMEGGFEMSFAGQYRSLLNVPAEAVVEAFKRVVASKYSPEALTYRMARGFDDDEVAMCCCVIEMVDAVSAGVLYSACRAGGEVLTLIQAVRGLGQSAVDGSAEPDSYWVDCRTDRVVERRAGSQEWQIVSAAPEGTVRLRVPPTDAGQLILDDARVLEIAGLASTLGPLLPMPVDVEWAIGPDGRVFVLQLRPQPVYIERPAKPIDRRADGYPVLLAGGSPASSGSAAGPVCRVERGLDILRCPAGAVLVTHEASPRLAVLLPRVAAVVGDMGEVTGHLATVARELKVPALLATRTATARLVDGMLVTVDADAAVVYEGRVDALLGDRPARSSVRPVDPNRSLLASVADRITPLTLRDRLASGYSPRACRTLHDIIRFCHQATIEAMFDLGDRALKRGERLRRLVTEVPIDCRLMDLGGGLEPGADQEEVSIEDIACRPMRALWAGMTDRRLRWNSERPVSFLGFVSAMVNYNFDQDARMRNMGEPSYAFITRDYLNLNSRIGFHFSTVDARVGEVVESNYVSFRFVGGSTGIDQRSRRASLIHRLLSARGFETDCRADLLNARLRHKPPQEMDDALFLVGLMMGYVNHLDMALVSDEVMTEYEQAFLAGDYGFSGGTNDA
jgi:pyruvate,water dikinase